MATKPEFRLTLSVQDFETLKEIIERDSAHHRKLWQRAQEQAQVAGDDPQAREIAETARKALINLHGINTRRVRLKENLGLISE